MTDNEIIKALECCYGNKVNCNECPMWEYEGDCFEGLMKHNALSLINRQKAEIEKLELLNASLLESCEGYSKACDVYRAEIERLVEHTKEGIDLAKQLPEMLKLAQAGAIKYFAERLKHKATETHNTIPRHYRYVISNDFIDNLVKEMVGDRND